MNAFIIRTSLRYRRRSAALAGAALLLGALLTGCAGNGGGKQAAGQPPAAAPAAGTGSATEKPKVVRIGYQKGNTLNILKVKGNLDEALKKQGIAVEWNVFPSGGTVLEALTSGKIDYGNAADGSGVFAQAGGKPFVYVGNDLPNPEGMGIMVHRDSPIKTIADLKGKKVAVVKGGNHHYLTVLALERAGLKDNDVEYVFVKDASEGRAVFETKKVDALGSWDPFFATVQIDLKPVTLTDGADYSPNRTFYYATVDFTQKYPDLVKLILEETDVADKWANRNKPEVVKLLTQELGIDEASIRTAVERRTYGVEAITKDIIAPQQQLADTFYRIGLINEKLDVSKLMPVQAPWAPDLKR
ncbi:sulfonate ABC transporter substrate-binding protein [Paenibacillus flagellatus]|uniref:Putative aliphatic sulfonates-binding protein n=1 Tax=Paenibacillus flagellatus TaxID=2211139 RepID=A0A2V5KHX4_9BACL|nr:sulfonate ABC transporter substrate-binding protein [Paenibacillus flagellatus]PYI53990.1 sulfonate ABC transporter substrate-binding protein [Paenibacillus flagellatus]